MRALIFVVGACSFEHGKLPAIRDAALSADAAIDAMLGCPADYVMLSTAPSLYRIGGGRSSPEPGRTSWVGAEADCRDDGGGAFRRTHLAIADSAAEHLAFETVIGVTAVSGASKWLGVSDRKLEGQWVPITGVMPWFTDWGSPPPTPSSTNDDCLLLDRTLVNTMVPCADTSGIYDKGFICECDDKPVDLSTF